MEEALVEALGKANAIICLQSALVAKLVQTGKLTVGDAAELTAIATTALEQMKSIPDDVRKYANQALTGFARAYTKRLSKN